MNAELIKYTSALLKGLADNAQDYRNKKETAKTKCKKKYYEEKLKKNNLQLMHILTIMEKLSKGNK